MNPSSFDWKGANKIRDVVTVPALLGTRISHALLILSAADLEAAVTEAADTNFGEGHVVKVDPHAGTEVERGSTVALTVSAGPNEQP
jgi:beta-lactam-binding protein with PASTA domain